MKCKIYILSDPDTKEVRYVGMTNNLPARLYKYRNLVGSKSRNNRWVALLAEQDKFPIVTVIEVCESGHAEERERHWIQYWKKRTRLNNITDGGRGGATTTGMKLGPHSAETRRKISATKTGVKSKLSEAERKANGQKVLALRRQNGTTNKGKTWRYSEEVKVRFRISARKRANTPEGRVQILKAGFRNHNHPFWKT